MPRTCYECPLNAYRDKVLCANRKKWHRATKEKMDGTIPVASKQDFIPSPCYGRRQRLIVHQIYLTIQIVVPIKTWKFCLKLKLICCY